MKRLSITVILCAIFLTYSSQIIGSVDITKIKSDIVSIKLSGDYPFYFTYDIGKTVKIDFKTYIIHNKRSFKPKSSGEWIQFFNAYGWELSDRESTQSNSSSYATGFGGTKQKIYTKTTLTFKKTEKPNLSDISKSKDLKELKESKEMLDLGVISEKEYIDKVTQFRDKYVNVNFEETNTNKVEIVDEKLTEEQLLKKLKYGFKEKDQYTRLKQGYEVLYKNDKKYYTGNVKFKNSLGNYTIFNIKKYNEINKDWEELEIENSSIPLNNIIGFKL